MYFLPTLVQLEEVVSVSWSIIVSSSDYAIISDTTGFFHWLVTVACERWTPLNTGHWAWVRGLYTQTNIIFINEILNSLCKFLQLITKYMLRSASYSKGFWSLRKGLNMELVTRYIIYWKIKKENIGKEKKLLYNTVASCRINSEFQIENPVCLEVFLFII